MKQVLHCQHEKSFSCFPYTSRLSSSLGNALSDKRKPTQGSVAACHCQIPQDTPRCDCQPCFASQCPRKTTRDEKCCFLASMHRNECQYSGKYLNHVGRVHSASCVTDQQCNDILSMISLASSVFQTFDSRRIYASLLAAA